MHRTPNLRLTIGLVRAHTHTTACVFPKHHCFPHCSQRDRATRRVQAHTTLQPTPPHTPICSKRPSLPSMQLSARAFESLNEHGTHSPTPDLDVVVPALLRYLLHFTRHATQVSNKAGDSTCSNWISTTQSTPRGNCGP
jgi:hypothetical protein